ncbi:MAG: hypothetical protein WCM76_07080 [Bacteroidota bacterium]
MKKIALSILVIALLMGAGCSNKFSKSGKKEKEFVTGFLKLMDQENERQYTKMMNCISKKYIADNNIDVKQYKVDNYSIFGFEIISYDSRNGLIVTKVWGKEKSWIHQLTFKLSKESGKLYLVPMKHSDSYIKPWYEAKTYIKE